MNVLWSLYVILGSLLLAYIVEMGLRSPLAAGTAVSGWGVDAFELVVALICLWRLVAYRSKRGFVLMLGCGLLCWCAGDVALTIESLGGRTPPAPSVADIFYLAFYPLAYGAVVLFMRAELRRFTSPGWLDGAVAGLGSAAVCAAFAFGSVVHSTGAGTAAAAVGLAYPIGDLLLLALVIGGTALVSGRGRAPWLFLAGACSLTAVGDTFNLLQSNAVHPALVGTVFNAVAWPGAFLLMSMVVWLEPKPPDPLAVRRPAGLALPGLGALAGLGILFVGAVHGVSRVAIGLGVATLVLAGVRLTLSARSLRILTEDRRRQSMTDELTDLGNRRHLFHVLEKLFSGTRGDPRFTPRAIAFLFLDLDRFKEINDSFGHHAGDELLRQLGPRLLAVLREKDILVRLGGDEFGVLLLDADEAVAREVGLRLIEAVQAPFLVDALSATIGASIGIALAPAHASDAETLLRHADTAMYRAKLSDWAIETYDPDLDGRNDLLRLAERLQAALVEERFVLHYQPQLDLRSGAIVAVEALLRWSEPGIGTVPPLKFLPVAEEAGLMPALTAFVLDRALRQCRAWHDEGRKVAVSVNVSPSNLLEQGFTAMVAAKLAQCGVAPGALVLEITETCIISNHARTKSVVEELNGLGVTVSIDDFGAGFTSLAHLSNLPVGELKLDRTFVSDLVARDNSRDLDLVRSTVDLGHSLGLRVVAEGVEDLATLDLLASVGCDLAQGYFISRPVPASELELGPALPPRAGGPDLASAGEPALSGQAAG
ncbi:MAG: putative bifunctional diguanylate cyclase/phosphodiesterase [Acidimicrobiales bacterium]